jgi:hypothetical protein
MRASSHLALRPAVPVFATILAGFAFAVPARADYIFGLDPHPNVITVTDATPEGKALPPPSPEHPVYYVAEDLGFREFGAPVPGDPLPPHAMITSVIVKTLEKQGYLPADKKHKPTQFILFNWGTMYAPPSAGALSGRTNQVVHPPNPLLLKFMGGDKVDLMWDTPINNPNISMGGGMADARILTLGLRSSIAQKIHDAAEGDLYVAALGGYDFQALRKGKSVELWQTRIACPADGLALADTIPVMIVAAGPQIGRDTPLPIWKDATEDQQGQVNLGELKVLGTSEPDAPVIDATKVDRKGAEDTP